MGLSDSDVSHAPDTAPRKRVHTKARLLRAAVEVLAERGYHASSIDEICTRAGYTRGAFYSNYSSKDELVVEVFDQYATQRRERLAALAASEVTPDTLARELLELNEQDSALSTVILEFRIHAVRNPALVTRLDQHDDEASSAFGELLAKVLPSDSTLAAVPPKQLATFLLALRAGTLTRILHGGTSAVQASEAFHTVLSKLISTT
ncbi:TetR/AcrR family transcriptional regulator [Kutzneria sp. NPDC052558]|uniref:TetR/AcrR family transcriptional regulator n=1 Tax=Kutzneria sp. NPDC052558 TaxID=3364121 RepID=UPI0037C6A044